MESNYACSKKQALYQWLSIRLSESCSEIRAALLEWKEYPNKTHVVKNIYKCKKKNILRFGRASYVAYVIVDHVHHS